MKKTYLKVLMKGGPQGPAEDDRPKIVSPKIPPTGPAERNTRFNDNIFARDLDFETLHPTGVQIMFMSEKEIEKISVVPIKKDEKDERKGNFEGTISDNRMWPRGSNCCSTCFLPGRICPGHLGYISLVRPIINVWAYKYVVLILESICQKCGSLLMNIESAKRLAANSDRLKKIAKISKNLVCRNECCTNKYQPNPAVGKKTDNMLKIQVKYPNNKIGFIDSTKILSLFNSISYEELEALGFPQDTIYNVHPRNLLFTKLPVIPENNRPTAIVDGEPKTDSLTNIYRRIIEVNNLLKSGQTDDRKTLTTLEDYVSSIHARNAEASRIGNPGATDTTKNIDERISKKKGLIRNNAMGKRCDHTGRTVIGPGGSDIPFGYLRLPQDMKKILVAERICDKNIEYYRNQIDLGNVVMIETQNMKIRAENRRADFVLRKGMVVRRKIRDNDPIIFNRNPTLYKHSMMGYLAKFGEGLTMGMHSSCTTAHNADFDGDECNVNVCPGYLARAEIIHLAGCWNNVVGSQFCRPIMGLVFNAITGAYLMSNHGEINDIDWSMYMDRVFTKSNKMSSRISSLRERVDRRLKTVGPKGSWKTGPSLFSALLPENFYYSNSGVIIEEGVLVRGRLKKSHVGPVRSSIVHMLYHHYGTQVVSQFISEGQILLDTFLERNGFTIGYRDCAMPAYDVKVKDIVEEEMKKAQEKLHNLLPLKDSRHAEERKFYSDSVEAALNNVKEIGNEIVEKALRSDNSFKIMAECGSKGSVRDIAMLIGIVGQQFLRENKRPPLQFNQIDGSAVEGLRFLPHYDIAHEGRPEKITSRGFVDQALGKGMRPGQFFSHMMASRLALIDTALGTAKTGYAHHCIVKALEDLRYGYNGTVCGDLGQVIQYAGGYDSYEPMELVQATIPGYGKIWSPLDIQSYVDMLNNEP